MRLLLIAAAALAASVGPGLAQEPASAPDEAQDEAQHEAAEQDEIVVLADPDQVRIDRRTYTLREDPAAQATDMYEILGRVPAVSVAPSGEVTLLGAPNVEIQINGQPVPSANLEQVLRGLTGSEVLRIEVITNPGAQYSAQASGGIINIITRQRASVGLNGSVQASVDTLGGYHGGVAITWTGGPWSFGGQAGFYHGEQNSDFERRREILSTGDVTTEDGARDFTFDGWYVSRLQGQYRPDERRRVSVALNAGTFELGRRQETQLSDAAGPLSSQSITGANTHANEQIVLEYEQNGDEEREVLKLNAAIGNFSSEIEAVILSIPTGGGGAEIASLSLQDSTNGNIKLDLEEPVTGDLFVTWGAAFDWTDQDILNRLTTISGSPPAPDYEASLNGRQQTLAAYATLQFSAGDWTWLPGLRAEMYWRELTSGAAADDFDELRLFPTLHIRRALTPQINVDLSYTSRISRPGFSQLDPGVRFIESNRALSGNPALEPTTTDAYEASFTYTASGRSFSLTFFDRISDDIISQFTETGLDGVIRTMPVNAGESEQRGLQALLRGPLGERWRYSLSANLLSRSFDYLDNGALSRRDEFEYDGVAQIDYRDPDQNAIGANQLQFEVRFQGPRHGLQAEVDPFAMANFTWRRRLSDNLFAALMVQDVFDSTSQVQRTRTDSFDEEVRFDGGGTRVRLALTYQFGSGPERQPQDQPPMPTLPMQ